MSGWICLHRGIQSHWIYADANKLKAWLDLLLTANIEDKKFMIKSQMITCKRGQLAVSQKTLEQRWKWSRNQVRHFLELLENDGMITIESNHLTSIITICNYREFQDLQPAKGTTEGTSKGTTEGTAEGKQLNNITIKQVNNSLDIGAEAPKISRHKFVRPTLEEIKQYCREENLTMNAEKFFYHFEANGWKSGNSKIQNWKMACKKWASSDYSKPEIKQPVRHGEWLADEIFEGDLPLTNLLKVN